MEKLEKVSQERNSRLATLEAKTAKLSILCQFMMSEVLQKRKNHSEQKEEMGEDLKDAPGVKKQISSKYRRSMKLMGQSRLARSTTFSSEGTQLFT